MYPVPRHSQKKVHKLSDGNPEFEQAYLKAHSRANRIVSDAELRELPNTFFYTMHRQQWARRANISEKLINYLKKNHEQARIMDLGCGNGWLGARIAQVQGFEVAAVDVNMTELQQGAKVFAEARLEFYYGDIFENIFPKGEFDFIILFEAICYFPKLEKLINKCREYLRDGGEIHILESPILPEADIPKAQVEQEAMYTELRADEMIPFHHFHSRQAVQDYDYTYLYRPGGLKMLFNKNLSSYPWIRIVN